MRWRHISGDFVRPTLSNIGTVWNTSVHQYEKLVTDFFELRASIEHAQYCIDMFSCACLVEQTHESLFTPMGYLFLQAPMLLPAWSNRKCSKTDSYERRHVFCYQRLLNLLLLFLKIWKKTSNVSPGRPLLRFCMSVARSGSFVSTASWRRSSTSWHDNSEQVSPVNDL